MRLPATSRGRTLLIASVLLAALLIGGRAFSVPYVALAPGPVTDTLSSPDGKALIQIKGAREYPSKGKLELTTVSVDYPLNLLQALSAWWRADRAVVPRDLIYPPDQSVKQVDTANQEQMAQSRQEAVTAALSELNLLRVVVKSATPGGPAVGKLLPGDRIVGVDGALVTSALSLRALIATRSPGEAVVIGYLRNGKPHRVKLVTQPAADDAKRPMIGVSLSEQEIPGLNVKIVGLDDVGGPSAGLMFALGIIDRLTPGDLTGGKVIAGTGTIDGGGVVGPIGGITLKMIAARRSGAAWFLTPAANCAEAKGDVPVGLRLVKITTLAAARTDLERLAKGNTDLPGC